MRSKAVLLAPDGPTHSREYEHRYFVETKDKLKHEVPMTSSNEFRYCGSFWPIEGTPFWVGAGINPVSNENTGHLAVIEGKQSVSHNENDLHLVVFDGKQITIHRTFSVVPKWESSDDEFRACHELFGRKN